MREQVNRAPGRSESQLSGVQTRTSLHNTSPAFRVLQVTLVIMMHLELVAPWAQTTQKHRVPKRMYATPPLV